MAIQVQEVGKTSRMLRSPQHTFQIRQRPWQIQPFLIAPVLPGETMKNLLMQARVVTDPIKNPLIGWWAEFYFFYVKHRDLAIRDALTAMMLDPTATLTAYNAVADVPTYHYGGTINWTQRCLERVVEEYFRDEGEAWNAATIGTLPAAKLNSNGWYDSLIDKDDYSAFDPAVDANADGTIRASEVESTLANWQWLRANNLTEMTYEDFLRTYGVSIPKEEELHKPELVRYVREWTYPSNTVDPATGTPSSACSWSIAERADKDRFFKEPGFLFGCSVMRPKVYFSKQTGSAVGMLDNAISWLPALLKHDPSTSLKKIAAGGGPVPTFTDAFWVDVRDLFLYGDQFLNFELTATDAGLVALPAADLQRRYASATDADGLFKTSTVNLVRSDGVVNLKVLGTQQDYT
nr:MAG: major capsid protein [Microvirus sp.]